MKHMTWLTILMVLLSGAAYAQPSIDKSVRNSLAWDKDNQRKADIISTVLVATSLAVPCTVKDMRADSRWTCLENEGIRVGISIAAAELVKHFVHRTRPNGSDNKSFYSEHTTIACAATLHTKAWEFCPAVGYLRVAANKHWVSDVGTGAAAGALLAFNFK